MIHWKPAVERRWLLLLAGIIWMAVGIMLAAFASTWLRSLPWTVALPFALAGVLVAVVGYRMGFFKLAIHNIQRIHRLPDRAWIFAFQAGKAYIDDRRNGHIGRPSAPLSFSQTLPGCDLPRRGGCLFLASLLYYPPALAQF